jgi:MPBQ/MSBQ methyltransferase
MDVQQIVKGHYGRAGLEGRILDALREAGIDTEALTWRDLAPVDELHAGFLPATQHLLALLDLGSASRLLDVGCGLGGPARAAAAEHGCHVTGIDLSPDFVDTATALTDRVGLADRVGFQATSGDALPFPDGAFDRAMMIHVGMNVPDKRAVFEQVRRVLQSGGLFGVFEQARVGPGALTYPLPWADDERSSFVESTDEYVDQLTAAGFVVQLTEDRTEQAGGPPPPGAGPRLGPQAVFGPDFMERIRNNLTATAAGVLAPVVIIARAG